MHHAILTRQQALRGCGIPIRYKLNGRLNNNRIKRWNVTKVGELLFADDKGQPHSTAKQCAEASQMTASNMRKWCLQTNAQKTKILHVKWWMRKSNLDVRRKAGLPHKMEQVIHGLDMWRG